MKKRFLSILLAVVLVVSLLPVAALATEGIPLTCKVEITGTEAVGYSLTAEVTDIDPSVELTYQWYRCPSAGAPGELVKGASNKRNVSTPDAGYFLKVRVSAAEGSGYQGYVEATTKGVIKEAFKSAPSITYGTVSKGPLLVGETLQASIANTGELDASKVDFQWLRCDSAGSEGTAISGATAGSYKTTEEDLGKFIRVKITGKPTSSRGGSKISKATPRVKNPAAKAPTVTVSDVTVTATTVTLPTSGEPNAYEYSLDGTIWNDTSTFTGLTAATQYTYYIRLKETDTDLASEKAEVAVYTAAETPANVGVTGSISYTEETFTLNNGYEISTKNGTDSGNTFADGKLTPDGSGKVTLEPGTTYYVRKAASGSIPASAAVNFELPARPETPNMPSLISKTDTSITFTAVEGQEYSIDGGSSWVTGIDNKVTFTGLSGGTAYKIITRKAAVTTTGSEEFASANSETSLITTKSTEHSKAAADPVDVSSGKVISDETEVVVTDDGERVSSENLVAVAEAINVVLNNDKVKNFGKTTDETGLDAATEKKNGAIANALKALTKDTVAKSNINEANITKYLKVTLASSDVDVDTTIGTQVTVNKMGFEITPMATVTVMGKDGNPVTLTTEINKKDIDGNVTFLLPVDKTNPAQTAAVYRDGKFLDNYAIKDDGNGNKYIEVTTDSFGAFSYIALNETTAEAKIGTTLYASLADAIAKAENDQTITLLKDISGTVTVSRAVKFTVDNNSHSNTAVIVAGGGYRLASDGNTYTITKKSSGSIGVLSYTVKFDTNGGNTMKNVSVKVGQTIGSIETPKKEGFVFDGWFSDKELTKPYNVDEKVTKSTTLYANWKVDPVRQIVLTIGKKEATVFTEEKVNDVAPKIVNDRTMLPIRFIAEALGATVDWDGEKQLVTISGEGLKIEITIGKSVAFVNGNEVKLDSPAFIENDRTYLPLRFVAENLGAEVEWVEETQQVVITKALPEKAK